MDTEQNREPLSMLTAAVTQAGEVIAGIRTDQADLPTPCRSWDVRQLVNHVIDDLTQFTRAATGGRADWSAPAPDAGADWAGAYRTGADALLAAWGRADLSGTTELPGLGEVPARLPIDMQVAELAVHAWDLAVATGQKTDGFDPTVAEAGLAFMRTMLVAEYRGSEEDGKSFGPEVTVAEDSSPYDRLAAFAGRAVGGLGVAS